MFSRDVVPLLLQLGLPLALLAWQAFGRDRSVAAWLFKTAVVALYVAATAVAGLWLLLPWYTPAVYLLVLGVMAPWQFWSRRALPWRAGRLSWAARGVRAALAVLAVTVLIVGVDGRRLPPEESVELAFPLRQGTYYVTGGGSAELINPHLETLTADRFRAYRGQSYGVDIVKIGALGMRASGLAPSDPSRYAVFGDAVHAPCSGVVVRAEDGLRDLPPPEVDRSHMAGNHVLLNCGGVHVLLAHPRLCWAEHKRGWIRSALKPPRVASK